MPHARHAESGGHFDLTFEPFDFRLPGRRFQEIGADGVAEDRQVDFLQASLILREDQQFGGVRRQAGVENSIPSKPVL